MAGKKTFRLKGVHVECKIVNNKRSSSGGTKKRGRKRS